MSNNYQGHHLPPFPEPRFVINALVGLYDCRNSSCLSVGRRLRQVSALGHHRHTTITTPPITTPHQSARASSLVIHLLSLFATRLSGASAAARQTKPTQQRLRRARGTRWCLLGIDRTLAVGADEKHGVLGRHAALDECQRHHDRGPAAGRGLAGGNRGPMSAHYGNAEVRLRRVSV